MRRVELVRYTTPSALLNAAADYLAAREAEHNLLLGILGTLRDRPEVGPEPPFLAAVTEQSVVLVAVRTPPSSLVLSELGVSHERVADALTPLLDELLREGRELPGVLGPPLLAGWFAAAWSAATGSTTRLAMAERIYRVAELRAARPVPGRWRRATDGDRQLLQAWVLAFQAEALPASARVSNIEAMLDRWIQGAGRTAYLWEVDGQAVSLVVAGSPTPHGIRIGPVYTPPVARRRGYASALTAAVSQEQIDRGCRYCFLFTDLANPTSNQIYQSIGYEPVTDVAQYSFARAPDSGSGGAERPQRAAYG